MKIRKALHISDATLQVALESLVSFHKAPNRDAMVAKILSRNAEAAAEEHDNAVARAREYEVEAYDLRQVLRNVLRKVYTNRFSQQAHLPHCKGGSNIECDCGLTDIQFVFEKVQPDAYVVGFNRPEDK